MDLAALAAIQREFLMQDLQRKCLAATQIASQMDGLPKRPQVVASQGARADVVKIVVVAQSSPP